MCVCVCECVCVVCASHREIMFLSAYFRGFFNAGLTIKQLKMTLIRAALAIDNKKRERERVLTEKSFPKLLKNNKSS